MKTLLAVTRFELDTLGTLLPHRLPSTKLESGRHACVDTRDERRPSATRPTASTLCAIHTFRTRLREQNLRRRPSRRGLRPISSARECVASSRPMAILRHRLSDVRPYRRFRQGSQDRTRDRFPRWRALSKTTWKSTAAPPSAISRPTWPAQTKLRWRCKTTAIQSVTATSGSANSDLECGSPAPAFQALPSTKARSAATTTLFLIHL